MTSTSTFRSDRGSRDNAVLKFILILITNLLSIKDPQASIRSTTENFLRSNLQDELIARLEEEHILEFLVTLASSLTDFRFAEWNLDLLDIFSLIFQDRDPKNLFAGVGLFAVSDATLDDDDRPFCDT